MRLTQEIKMFKKKKNKISVSKILNKKKFNFIRNLKQKFPKAEIFLVGGAVRDLFLSKKTQDYDFVVRKVRIDELEKFLAQYGQVNLVGQTFGVFKFIPFGGDAHNPFDIALPRKDFSLGTGGYRDVEIQTNPNLSIEGDLGRRDFTINAMAIKISVKSGPVSNRKCKIKKSKIRKCKLSYELIDPFNGYQDLKKKIIRAVGRPIDRFKEDYSRMLRAIRFSCQLNFKIEEKTWQALKSQMKFINKIERSVETETRVTTVRPLVVEKRVVSYEIIAKEIIKALIKNPVKFFDLADESGVFRELIPELLKMKGCPQPENYHSEGDVWQHTRLALKQLGSSKFKKYFKGNKVSKEVIVATLFHDLGKPYTIRTPENDGTDRIRFNEHDIVGAEKTKEILQRLKFSSPDKIGIDIEEAVWLVKEHMILIRGAIENMKPGTIEKYFFNRRFSGEKLLQVSFLDIAATITKNGPLSFDKFNQMIKRIKELKSLSKSKKELPKPLVNGKDIIKKFKLSPGPKIGQLLEIVREKQLNKEITTKKQGLELLKKYLKTGEEFER